MTRRIDAIPRPARAIRLAAFALLASVLAAARSVPAQETIVPLVPLSVSTGTGEKPQSKLWFHDGRWFAILPSATAVPSGTWVWRLESNKQWANILLLNGSTSTKADVKQVGDVVHVLLHTGSAKLVSLQYQPKGQTYVLWPKRPTPTALTLPSSETATIDIDSTGRMWLATDSLSDMTVYYSDPPYARFDGPIVLASGTSTDDICVVRSVPLRGVPSIGVLWSNQVTQLFGFRLHVDGVDPLLWLADEMPAQRSALHVGLGMADDHLNVAAGSDGTLYAAVKTGYNKLTFPQISLLVRRPGGQWDDLYFVEDSGTRGIVLLNEPANLLRVIYREDVRSDIVYRDSLMSAIGFGAQQTLIPGPVNDPTSTKDNWTDQVVVMASGSSAMFVHPTTTTIKPGKTTTTTTSTTSTTLLPPGVIGLNVSVAAASDDAEEAPSGKVTTSNKTLTFGPQTVGLRFAKVAVPRGATILAAYVQLGSAAVTTDTSSLQIQGQASDQAATFTTAIGNVSTRPRTTATANWSPAPWTTTGAQGPEQQTVSLAAILQEIVDRPGWASGNPVALVTTGTGSRVATSRDGKSSAAPLLHVEYALPGTLPGGTLPTTTTTIPGSTTTTVKVPTTTTTSTTTSSTTTTLLAAPVAVDVPVATAADDASQAASGKVSLSGVSLEFGTQIVGLRFAGVTVPPKATIVTAYVQFQVSHATALPTTLQISGQASDSAPVFSALTAGDLSSRAKTKATVSWVAAQWQIAAAAGPDQRTANLASIVQEIVNRAKWARGNSLALIFTGTGQRAAKSADTPHGAPVLHIEYR